MSQITAIIGDTSTIGYIAAQGTRPGGTSYTSYKTRRNPQNAVARIRTVMNPHIVQEVPGGLISADFTIPAEEAQRWRPLLRYGAYCWLFDGHTPIFFGLIDQPVWTVTGDAQILVNGPWPILGRARTREIWELRDLTVWNRSTSSSDKRDAADRIRGDGTLLLSFANGSTVNSGQFVAVEYILDQATGFGVTPNQESITGFEVRISDATFNSNANLVFRVQAIADSSGAAGTTLWSSTTTGSSNRQTADDVFSENSGGTWNPTQGLRVGIFATANITAGGSLFAGVDRLRITTRQSLFPANTATQDTAAIARDLLAPQSATSTTTPAFRLPEPFWPSDASNGATNEAAVKYGLDALTGTGSAPNSGIGVTGFNATDWTSPSEILLQLAGIDGYHVGFYLPYNQRGGYDAGNVNDAGISLWLSARPQLYYQAWLDPKTSPDYTIHIREGATLENHDQRSQLVNTAYANYQTLRGRNLSSFYADGDPTWSPSSTFTEGSNWLSNQGFRTIEDWTVDGSSNSDLAGSIAQQMMQVRRNPISASVVTITNDGTTRFPILKAGTQIPHLSQIRPGSVRLVDVPAAGGLRQGYATRVEWWGQTIDEPEHIEMTLADPGQMLLERRIAWAAIRANRQRVSGG